MCYLLAVRSYIEIESVKNYKGGNELDEIKCHGKNGNAKLVPTKIYAYSNKTLFKEIISSVKIVSWHV